MVGSRGFHDWRETGRGVLIALVRLTPFATGDFELRGS